jgi:hypothetical protein
MPKIALRVLAEVDDNDPLRCSVKCPHLGYDPLMGNFCKISETCNVVKNNFDVFRT